MSADLPTESTMGGWVREKMAVVLDHLVRLADTAKHAETPDWYRRNLRQSLQPAIASALEVLLWSQRSEHYMAVDLHTRAPEHGASGAAAARNELGIARPIYGGERAVDLDDSDDRKLASDEATPGASERWTERIRQRVVRTAMQRLDDQRIPAGERRLLSWITYHLAMSDYPDVAFLTRHDLASDVRLTDAECQAALAALIARGHVYEERGLGDEQRIALRVLVPES
jgi:hypothetical protein